MTDINLSVGKQSWPGPQ